MVHSARPVLLQSSSATSATVRAAAGKPAVVRLGAATFGSFGGSRGLTIEPGGDSWAGGAPGPGGMLVIGDVTGEQLGSSLDMTLTSERGAVRVGPFVLRRDAVENTDGDLVLQTGGGAGGLLMLAPDGHVVTDANVTVAGSLRVDGLTANASDHSVSTRNLQLHAQVHAHAGVVVQSGDLIMQEGFFVTGEGIDLNVNGTLTVGGSVTIAPPDPETSNRTGGNLSVVGALRVRGARGVYTSTFDATAQHLHSVGGIRVDGLANFSGNVRLGYGPGSSLKIMSETTHLDTFTTRSFATLGSAERSGADIAFHTGSFVMMSTLGADAFHVYARADEPETHGVVTGGSFDGLGNFTCPSSVILGDENSDSITVRGLLTLHDRISCGRSFTVEGPAHIGSPELPVGWTAKSLECSEGLRAIVRGWELSPRLKLVQTETVTFNMLAERPLGTRKIEFGGSTRDSWGIYRARSVITGDVSAHNLTVGGETRWAGSASIGGDLSISGDTRFGGALRLGRGLHMSAGKTARWHGQLTFQTNTCDGNNPTPLVAFGSPSTQRECEATGYSWEGTACSAGSALDETSCVSTGNVWTADVTTAQVRRRTGDMTTGGLSVGQDVLLSEATVVQGDLTVTPTDPSQLGLAVPRLDVGLDTAIAGSLSVGKNFDNGGSLSFGSSGLVEGSVSILGDVNSTGSVFVVSSTGASQFIADVRGDVRTVGSLYIGGDTTIGGDVEFGTPGVETNWTLNASVAYADPLEIQGSVTTTGAEMRIGSAMLRAGLVLQGALTVPHRPATWPARADGQEPIYDVCHVSVALEEEVEQYATTGIVHDGSWGYAYEHHPTDTVCERLLRAPAGHRVRLTFLEWDLRDQHDYLRVFDGDSLAHPRVGTFDGHDAVENGTVYSSGRDMLLSFHVEGQPAHVPQLHPETSTWLVVPPPPPTNTGWSARYAFIPDDVQDLSIDVKTVLTVASRVAINEERCEGVTGRECDLTPASGVGTDLDTCVASGLAACQSVVLDGNESTCEQAGKCTYTAKVVERCVPTDAEACANAALDGTGAACLAAGACTYTAPDANDPDILESCTATVVCADAVLDGSGTSCNNIAGPAGLCTYFAPVTEKCDATDEVVCATAPMLSYEQWLVWEKDQQVSITPTADGACEALPPAGSFIECAGRCIPQLPCKLGEDVCHRVAPYGRFTSCGFGQCVLATDCPVFEASPPPPAMVEDPPRIIDLKGSLNVYSTGLNASVYRVVNRDPIAEEDLPPDFICVESPAGWTDRLGLSCTMYVVAGWCFDPSDAGIGQLGAATATFPSGMEDSDGVGATMACCLCGGGTRPATEELKENATVITEGSVSVAGDLFANITSVEKIEIRGVRGRPDTTGLAFIDVLDRHSPEPTAEVCERNRCSGYVQGTSTASSTTCPAGCTLGGTCVTTEAPACASANADAATCNAAGACSFTAGTPNTCSTTVVSACAAANADEATCVAAGPCTFTETCKATVADCVTDYVPGDVSNPSSTCPAGCVFTPAARRTLDIIAGGKISAQLRDGGFISIGVKEMYAESRANGVAVDGVVVRSGTIIQHAEGLNMELHTHYGLPEADFSRAEPADTRIGRTDGEIRPDGVFDTGAGRRRLQYRRPPSALQNSEANEACVLRTTCTEDPCMTVGYPFVKCEGACVPIGHCVDPCHHLGDAFVVCLPVLEPDRFAMVLDGDFAAFQADPAGFVHHFEHGVAEFLSILPSRVVVQSVVSSSVTVGFSILPADPETGEPSLDEITTTLYASINSGVADDLFSDEHTAVIGHALQFSVEGRERPPPSVPPGSAIKFKQFLDLPTDYITWQDDECHSNPCANGATCYDEDYAYFCDCAPGWDGQNCIEERIACEDEENPCQPIIEAPAGMGGHPGARCTHAGPGVRLCACYYGYEGDGFSCVEVDDCLSAPCNNGGSCVNLVGEYTCTCPSGFMGSECDYATHVDSAKIVDRPPAQLAALLASGDPEAMANGLSAELAFFTAQRGTVTEQLKIGEDGHLVAAQGKIRSTDDGLAVDGNIFVARASGPSLVEVASLTDSATLSISTGGRVGAAIQYGPNENPRFYMRVRASPDPFNYDTIITPDSCTSTRVSLPNTVAAADAVNCVLTASVDFGNTAGSCAAVDASVATCSYVRGIYADSNAPAEELSLSGDVETFRVTKRATAGNIQDFVGDVSLFGDGTVGRIPDPSLLTQVVPSDSDPDTTYHPNYATANSGALRDPKVYPRTIVKECFISGDQRYRDHRVAVPADESCTVDFSEYLMVGESLEGADVSIMIQGDLDNPGEMIDGVTADGVEVASSCISNDGTTRIDPWSNIERTGPFSDCDDDGFHTCLQSVDVPITGCVATHIGACGVLGSSGTEPGEVCTTDSRCIYRDQGTGPTCFASGAVVCAAITTRVDCDLNSRCNYNNMGTLPSCVLAADVVSTCVAITDRIACNSHASCTFDAVANLCTTSTAASECTDEANNGATACTDAGDCTYDDGLADDVCEATDQAVCAAEAGNSRAACTAAGECTYDRGISDDVCEAADLAACAAEAGNGDLSCLGAGACSAPHAADGAVAITVHVSSTVNYCAIAVHAKVRLHLLVRGADHCASNPCPVSSVDNPILSQDFICYSGLDSYECLPPSKISIRSASTAGVLLTGDGDSALTITSGYNRDPKLELLDVWEPGSYREGYNIFLDGSQNAQECRNVPFGAADAGASQRELHETCENILLSIQLTATVAEPLDVSNPCRSPRFADSLPNCAWTCAVFPRCESTCADFSDCACGYCDSGDWPSLRMGREADTSKPTFFSIVDTGEYGSILLNGDLEVGRPNQAAPARMTVKSSVSAHLSSTSLHEDSFIQVIPGTNQMGGLVFGDKTDWTTGSVADAAFLLYNEGKPGKLAPATTESCSSTGAFDTVDIADSCTSVRVSDGTVVTTDTVNCVLTETVGFGNTPGYCVAVDTAVATCAYVAGSYSASGDTVTRKDTINCDLTPGLGLMGAPDGVSGSCVVSAAGAAVVPAPVTCAYVPTADPYRVDDCTTWHSSIITCAERNRPTMNFASGPKPDTLVTPDSCTSSSIADGRLTTSDTSACVLTPTTDFGLTPGSCAAVDPATATCLYVQGTFSASGVPNSVNVADSCTSTMLSGVSETDTILCALTRSPDFGATPGICAAVGASATCTFVAGQYSDTNNDGVPDQEDRADSCTSVLVSAVMTDDTSKCVLTGTPDFSVTPGSCAAVDPNTATCAYVGGTFSAYLKPIVKVVSYPEGVQESCVPEVTNPITTCSLTPAVKANPLANPPVIGVAGSCTITAGLGPCHYVEAVDGLGMLHVPGFARFGDIQTPFRPETCRQFVGEFHDDYTADVITCGSVDLTGNDKAANRLACLGAGTGSECKYTAPSSRNSVTVQSSEEATLKLLSKDGASVVRVMSTGPTEIGVREEPTADNSGGWYLKKSHAELTDDDPWPKLLLTADDDELGVSDTIVTLERIDAGTCVDVFGATVTDVNEADCLAWDPDHDGDGDGDGTDGPGVWTSYIYGMMTLNGDVTFGSNHMPPRMLTVEGNSAELRMQVENLDAAINIRGGVGQQAIVDFTDSNGGSVSIISQRMFSLGSDLMVRDGTALGGLVERWPLDQLAPAAPYRVVSFNTGVGAARLPVATMVNQRKSGVLLIQGTPTFGSDDLEMDCSVSVQSLLRADIHIASSMDMNSATPSDAVLQITSVERPSLVIGSVADQQFFRISVDTDEHVPTLLISDAVAAEDSPLFSVTSGPFTLDVNDNQIPVPPLVGKLYVSGHGQIGTLTSASRSLLIQTTGDGGQANLNVFSGNYSQSTLQLTSTGRFSERAIFQDKPGEFMTCTGVAATPSCAYSAGTDGCPLGCNDNGVACTGVATTPTCDIDPSTDPSISGCPSGCSYTTASSSFELRPAWSSDVQCTGTATRVPATCGSGTDGAGNACAVDGTGSACLVSSNTCSFVAAHTPICDTDAATDGTAACMPGCIRGTAAPWSTYIPDVAAAGEDFLSVIGNKDIPTSMLDIRRTMRVDGSGDPVATADIFINGDGTIGWVPPTILEDCVATDPSNTDDVVDCGAVVVSGDDDLMDQLTCTALASTVDGRPAICTYIQASDWEAVDVDFTLQSESTSLSVLSGGSADAVLQVTAGAARDAYLTFAREEAEACRAINLAVPADVAECTAVDLSGVDAAADQVACEAAGTGSTCAYVAQGTMSSYYLQKTITCPPFTKIEDSQIVGSEFTREELTGSVRDCEEACCIRYWCKTFDYQKAQGYCQLLGVHKDDNPQTQGMAAFMGPSTGMFSLTDWDHYEKTYGTSELRFGSHGGLLGTLTAGTGSIAMLTDFSVGSSTSISSAVSLESADDIASVTISSAEDDALLLMSSHSDAKSTVTMARGDSDFQLTKTGRHGCASGYFECGNSDCIPMADVCDGVETLRVIESCVATDPTNANHVATCNNVNIRGNAMCDANGNIDALTGAFLCDEQACNSWLVCTYTAGVHVVTVQSCTATDLDACAAVQTDAICYTACHDACMLVNDDSTCDNTCETACVRPTTETLCEAAGQCVYTADDPYTIMIDDTCTASSEQACLAVAQIGGDKATCESAGYCTYKPADCSDGSDEGWATCAGYGAYTQAAMDALGMGGLVSDYGVVPTPYVVSEVSAKLSLTTDSGENEMMSVYWSPQPAKHRLRVSRHLVADGAFNVQSTITKSVMKLGNGVEDAVYLRGSLVQSELRVYPTDDPDDVTTSFFRLRFPDPDPPTAQQIADGVTETEFVQTFPALSAELQAEGRPLQSVLLTARSAYSQLKQVGVLTSGSIAAGFGSIAATSIMTESDMIAGGALISDGTAWVSAGCMPPVNGEEGCTPVNSLLKLGNGHEDELSFFGVVQSQLILLPERSDAVPPNLYIPPVSGLIPGVSERCFASDAVACAEVVLDGTRATCTGAGICTYTPTAAEACVATDAAVCGAVDLTGNGNVASTCDGINGPSGNPCVHTPATDPNGDPNDGDETPETCKAQSDALCTGKTLDGDPDSCEVTGGGDCTWSAATTESCVATDLDACAAVDAAVPNGDQLACLSASSTASAARLAAGETVCVYSPGTTTCVGTAPSATGCVCNYEPVDCASALVPGNAASCVAAFGGACTYRPDSLATTANEEDCFPTLAGACTVNILGRDVDLANVNKIGWRSESLLTTDSKQFFLTAVFDPISEFSLGGSRELYVDDHGLPGHPASILWVGKPTAPQRIPAGATTLVSPYTAGLIEGDAATLAAGTSFSLTVTNPLLNANSLVYVTNVDDTYSTFSTNNRFRARPYRDGLTIAAARYPEAARPTLFYYVQVSAGQFTLTVQNADDFDAAATSLGYTWKVSWVAFI